MQIVGGVVVVLIVGLCSVWLFTTWRFMESGVSTYGHIIEFSSGGGDIPASPTFEFHTEAGRRYQVTGMGGFPHTYRKGERVPVIYDPNDPYNAKINFFSQTWWLPVLFSFFGLATAWGLSKDVIRSKRTSK